MEYDAMADSLDHLNRAVEILVAQNREREVTQNAILQQIAVLQTNVLRLTTFIDGERMVEKLARLEERSSEGAAHRKRLEERLDAKDKEIDAISWKLITGLIGILVAIGMAVVNLVMSKLHI